jgi:hypothetical protein
LKPERIQWLLVAYFQKHWTTRKYASARLAIISGGQRGGVADAQAKGGTTPTGKETALAEQAE